MQVIKGAITAFSIYSRIPMPRIECGKEDMRYNLCFLPLVGAVIALLIYGGVYVSDLLALPFISKICIVSLIPLLVTGGFHMDGYMDVRDAVSSYKEREEKLRILKDPHIGAFAVISLVIYAIVWTGALAIILDRGLKNILIPLIGIFVLSREGAAFSSLTLDKAKNDGMLSNETCQTGPLEIWMIIGEMIATIAVIASFDACAAAIETAVLILFRIYYRHMTCKEFGGVTGDTAGYYVCVSELSLLVSLAAYSLMRSA